MVKYISDRIAVMHYGRLVKLASAEEVYTHPLHSIHQESLVCPIPVPDPTSNASDVPIPYDASKVKATINNVKWLKSIQTTLSLQLTMKWQRIKLKHKRIIKGPSRVRQQNNAVKHDNILLGRIFKSDSYNKKPKTLKMCPRLFVISTVLAQENGSNS